MAYQGWENYETWAAALWIDNDEPSYNYWRERATEAQGEVESEPNFIRGIWTADETARFILADWMKEELENDLPDTAGLHSDLLAHALQSIDYVELAKHYLEE